LEELQAAVGNQLADLTHNEAAYVSNGAAAGLALSTAAVVAGSDPKSIRQLPDTTGLKNEVIIHHSHRNGYDHAVRMVGVKIVEIGTASETKVDELEKAINEQTAAIVWFQNALTGHGDLPLETVIEIANRTHVPVIVDAADQVPPVENLWKYTQMGAALAIFSGGKDLCGPQASGLVVGRQELINAIRVNGNPNASLGRPMKVGKEEMVGLLTAVKLYLKRDHVGRASQCEEIVAGWCNALNRVSGVQAERSVPNVAGGPVPRAKVVIDAAKAGKSSDEIVDSLRKGTPSIEVLMAGPDAFYLNPLTLGDGEEEIVLDRLLAILN
jgi:L-seryl-tRNA(Ser) seleniumtransferase